jgi:hypothetical protein
MGSINFDNTGSGSDITLTSDGTSLLLDGTAVGGSPDLYAANPSSATDPTASGANAVAIGSGAVSGSSASDANAVAISTSATVSGSDGIAIGRNTSAGQYGTAIGRLSVASAYGSTALGANTDATANEAVAIGWTAQSTGVAAVALGNSYASGTDSFAVVIDNNTSSYGALGANSVAIGYSSKAANERSTAIGYQATVTGDHASAYGHQANASGAGANAVGYGSIASGSFGSAVGYSATASGSNAVALGKSNASGSHSFSAVLANTGTTYGATGSYSMAGGYLNKATATDTLCWGGDSNLVTSGQAAVVGGWMNQAEGGYSFIGGGRNNRALATYSRAGGHDADTNDNHGKDVWASGDFSSRGDAQTAKRVLRSDTTDATAEALTTDKSTAGTTNQVVLPNNSAYFFSGTCIARQQAADGTDVGAWEFKGAIRREANAGTTTLIKSTIDEFNVPTGWALALSADTTNGCLKIQVTGAASTDIRWVATVHTSEVTYA